MVGVGCESTGGVGGLSVFRVNDTTPFKIKWTTSYHYKKWIA